MNAGEVAKLTKPGRHLVERSLYLMIQKNGSRSWAQRLYLDGKRTDRGLGGYPAVGLKQARALADGNRAKLAAGGSLGAGKQPRERTVTPTTATVPAPAPAQVVKGLTFKQAAAASIAENGKVNADSRYQRQNRLDKHVLPLLGGRLVEEITRGDVLQVLLPIKDLHATRNKALGEIAAVLDWCEAYDHVQVNPARSGKVRHQVNQWGEKPTVTHRQALPHSDIPGLLKEIHDSEASQSTIDALELMILTAARPGEIAGMTWAEVDLDAGLWVIPAERMKMARPHRVPLSVQASVLLRMRQDLKCYQPDGLVLPSPRRRKSLAVNTFAKLFREHGVGAVPHGCRSSFRDWAAEHSGASREAIELSLAHQVGNAVERAYFRTDLLEERRTLMQAWGDYLAPTIF